MHMKDYYWWGLEFGAWEVFISLRGDFGGKKTKMREREREGEREGGEEARGDELLGFSAAMKTVPFVYLFLCYFSGTYL